MSHAACLEPEPEAAPEPPAAMTASYDCVNDCVSSLGVTTLVGGALASAGCLLVSGGSCAALIGAGTALVLGSCEAACNELESKP